jgi:hypothetical protein
MVKPAEAQAVRESAAKQAQAAGEDVVEPAEEQAPHEDPVALTQTLEFPRISF